MVDTFIIREVKSQQMLTKEFCAYSCALFLKFFKILVNSEAPSQIQLLKDKHFAQCNLVNFAKSSYSLNNIVETIFILISCMLYFIKMYRLESIFEIYCVI